MISDCAVRNAEKKKIGNIKTIFFIMIEFVLGICKVTKMREYCQGGMVRVIGGGAMGLEYVYGWEMIKLLGGK